MSVSSIQMMFSLLGSIQGLLIAAAVISIRQGPRRANRLLALMLFGSSIVMIVVLLSHSPIATKWIGLELIEYSLWLFAGPAVLLYVSLVTHQDEWPSRLFFLNLAPGLVWLAYLAQSTSVSTLWLPPVLSLMLHQIAYSAFSVWVWSRSNHRRPANGFHEFWIRAILILLTVLHVVQFVRWTFHDVVPLENIVPLAGGTAFFVLTFIGLRRSVPFLNRGTRRYRHSSLTDARARAVTSQLEEAMERDRLFLDPGLGLAELANRLAVSKTHLSQVLNERLGKSFLNYISSYRLRESQRLLLDHRCDHLKIEAIARRSGFKSRSTFYEQFCRVYGMTPSEFRRLEATSKGSSPYS